MNYQVDMHDRRKRFQVFHVKMLKAYHIRLPMHTNCFMDEKSIEEEENEVPFWNDKIQKQESTSWKHRRTS